MDNIKNDSYYLDKIRCDLAFVIEHTSNKSQSDIESDPILIDSIMFRIIQIAENATKLTDAFKQSHSNVPWIAIKGMRNKIVHNYGIVNMSVVYDTVKNGIPEMYKLLCDIH